jgi:hypothetical protein
MLINLFAMIGVTLLTPLFNGTPGYGAEKYGLMMGSMMAGAVAGMVALSAVKIRADRRSAVFGAAIMTMVCSTVPIGLILDVNWLYPLAFLAGTANAFVNVMVQTIIQSAVAARNRGKVFGILATVTGGLQPLSMALSGAIAIVAGIRPAITAAFSLLVVAALPLLIDKNFKAFIDSDADEAPAAGGPPAGPEAVPAPPLPGFPDDSSSVVSVNPESTSESFPVGATFLPTFTYPPNVPLATPTAGQQVALAATPTETPGSVLLPATDGLPPVVPILILGALGVLGLAISSVRR